MALVEQFWSEVLAADGTRPRLYVTYDDVPDAQGRLEVRSARCVNPSNAPVQPYLVDTSTDPATRLSSDVGPLSEASWAARRRTYYLTKDADDNLNLPPNLQVGLSVKW